MNPLIELHLGRTLLAIDRDPDGPRWGGEILAPGSWWIELRLFGRLIGLYR